MTEAELTILASLPENGRVSIRGNPRDTWPYWLAGIERAQRERKPAFRDELIAAALDVGVPVEAIADRLALTARAVREAASRARRARRQTGPARRPPSPASTCSGF